MASFWAVFEQPRGFGWALTGCWVGTGRPLPLHNLVTAPGQLLGSFRPGLIWQCNGCSLVQETGRPLGSRVQHQHGYVVLTRGVLARGIHEAKAGVSNTFVDHSEPAAEVLATCFVGMSCQCRGNSRSFRALSGFHTTRKPPSISSNRQQQQHHHHSSATFSSSSNSYQQRSPTALTTANSQQQQLSSSSSGNTIRSAATCSDSIQQLSVAPTSATAFSNSQQQQQH